MEQISMVAMRSKELWLVQENLAIVKLQEWKLTAKAELNYKIYKLKKILERSSQYSPSEQPWGQKSFDAALKIAGVEKIHSENLRLQSA